MIPPFFSNVKHFFSAVLIFYAPDIAFSSPLIDFTFFYLLPRCFPHLEESSKAGLFFSL
jgi:hypothetical protein